MSACLRRCWCALWLAACLSAFAGEPAGPVSLVFAGDIVLDDAAGEMIARGADPFADFAGFFSGADVRVVNLECVIATTGSAGDKNYTFRAHPDVLPVLKRHFDVLALANNHSGDFGRDAFAEMLGLIEQAGLAQVGGGLNLAQAHTPLIIERKGVRIALLAYSEFMPRSFEADFDAPGVAWSEDEQVVADIRQARRIHHADIVIPLMHWGWENELTATARQRQLARTMIDAGADAVIGGHPHVTQDIEQYRGKPIVYSVGNFVMKETDNENQRRGWLLRLQLDKLGVIGFDTRVAQIDLQGMPRADRASASPCWNRGETGVRQCTNPD